MGTNLFHNIISMEFSIPLHKDCPDFIEYINKIREIQRDTHTNIKVAEIVRIKGKEMNVEEARRRLAEININSYKGEKRLQEIHQILDDVQNKIFKLEREKEAMAETIEELQYQLQDKIQIIKKSIEKNHKKVEIEMAETSRIIQKSQQDLNRVQIKIDQINDELSEGDVDLDAFCKSCECLSQNIWERQPFHIASKLGRLDVVRKLTKDGQNVNDRDTQGWTMLHLSAYHGHLKIVEHLIGKNAEINETTWGYTPLVLAVLNGHESVVEYLCSSGADINIKTKENHTALEIAQKNNKLEIVRIIQKYSNQD